MWSVRMREKMNVFSVVKFLARPGPPLMLTYFALVLLVAFVFRDGPVLGVVLILPFIALLLIFLMVSACTPKPPPLSDRSALLARSVWLLKVLWGAFTFAAAAAYGTFVAQLWKPAFATADGSLEFAEQTVVPVVLAAFAIAGWAAMMGTAWDLIRAGKNGRAKTIASIFYACHLFVKRVETELNSPQNETTAREMGQRPVKLTAPRPLLSWLRKLFQKSSEPWPTLVTAYLSPVIIVMIWNTLLPNGDPQLSIY